MRALLVIILSCAFAPVNCQSNIEQIVGRDLDTIVDYRDKTFIVGPFEEKKDVAGNSYGLWKEYYSSGKLKGSGTLAQGSYIQCCTAGPCEMRYMYKLGYWKYFYESGKIKAEGSYNTEVYNFPTSCEGGHDILVQKVTSNWKFYDENGSPIKKTNEVQRDLEAFYTSYGKFYKNR